MIEKKSNRGGARQGAGRKPIPRAKRHPFSIRVDDESRAKIAVLKERGISLSDFVINALKTGVK